MRRVFVVWAQIVAAAIGIAAIGGLIGLLIAHLAHWGGASRGFSLGMIVGGVLVLVVAGGSGSPSNVKVPSASWGNFAPAVAPRNCLQIALGGVVAIAAGIGVTARFGY